MRSSMIVCMCFGALAGPAVVDLSAAQESHDFRKWVDDTGQHSIVAAFVAFQNDHVRLKRQDGQVITVPTARLSQSDRRYLAPLKQKSTETTRQQPSPARKAGSKQPRTGECRFQVSGLMHTKHYNYCEDCWKVIEAEEGCRELRRYISGCWTGEAKYGTDPRAQKRRWNISTETQFPLDTDLAPIAKTVATAKTPHRTARAFYALLYTTRKTNQVKAIQAALAGLPGVDARQSTVDVTTGRIHVRISGQKPICITDLVAALENAGVKVATSRPGRQ